MSLPRQLPPPNKRTARDHLAASVTDLVGELLYYGRKEDENLPRGAIQAMVAVGDASADEIVELFRLELEKRLRETS